MLYPKSIALLIDNFQKLPSVGEKTAERMALSILNMDEDEVIQFSDTLKEVKEKIRPCSICNNITDQEKCIICVDKHRNEKELCVVCDPKDIISIEKANIYKGKYFVLNNLISPLNGVSPESINFDSLLRLIEENEVNEVILALKSTIEGETTALYIRKILEEKPVKVTKLASGLPLGIEIEYIDALTLERAIIDRTSL